MLKQQNLNFSNKVLIFTTLNYENKNIQMFKNSGKQQNLDFSQEKETRNAWIIVKF